MEAYLYRNNESVILMITAPLPPNRLARILPLTDLHNKTHLVAHFVDGVDFLGAANASEIDAQVRDYSMIPISNSEVYDLGDSNLISSLIGFADEQMKKINFET